MPCENPDYQDFCGQIYKYAPACEDIDKERALNYLSYPRNHYDTSLILRLFELGKLFIENKMVKFSSQGTCMYPCIKPNDILHIEPCNMNSLKIGDIAVYRRFNRLFAHRVIRKGDRNGQGYIITRPDSSKAGDDGETFDKDILGLVVKVERKGKEFYTEKKEYPALNRVFYEAYIGLYNTFLFFKCKLFYLFLSLQQGKSLRKFLRFCFFNKELDFSLQAPLNSSPASRFSRIISLNELSASLASQEPVPKWSVEAKVGSLTAGYISFLRKPERCPFCGWWIYEANIRARYRSTSIEEKFLRKVDELLRELKIKEASVSVFSRAGLEYKFFSNLGFREKLSLNDKLLDNRYKDKTKRIIMAKEIN